MKKSSKLMILAFSALGMTAALTLGTFSSLTASKYVESKKTAQSAFGLGGEREVSIFLNANIWKQGKDSSGNIVDATFYMYAWYNNGSGDSNQTLLAASAHVTPTIPTNAGTKMDLYVFEYDTTKWNRMAFFRWNPDVAPTLSNLETGIWNQTNNIAYNSERNYYCIKTWKGSATYNHSCYEYNRIDKAANGNLDWGNPDGHDTLITS